MSAHRKAPAPQISDSRPSRATPPESGIRDAAILPARRSPARVRRNAAATLSVVVPLYNEAESLVELQTEIRSVCDRSRIPFETIFVDDGSTDGSFEVIERLHRIDPRVRAIQFRRNRGKAQALAAGFRAASGRVVVTMDADLQDDPSEIPNLLATLAEGFDLVSGWKKTRHDPLSKRLPSKLFNRTTSLLTGIRLHDFNCGLKAYRVEVVRTLKLYGELHRYIPALAAWEGFRVAEIPVHHRPRKHGKTKYGWSRYLYGLLDLITVMFLGRFTQRPLHLFGSIGLVSASVGGAITLVLVTLRVTHRIFLSNRPLLFLAIVLLILGIQFTSIGLLGEMITRSNAGNDAGPVRRTIGV
jgi:glycosyltransferase involved in cell wall biosynthesis